MQYKWVTVVGPSRLPAASYILMGPFERDNVMNWFEVKHEDLVTFKGVKVS